MLSVPPRSAEAVEQRLELFSFRFSKELVWRGGTRALRETPTPALPIPSVPNGGDVTRPPQLLCFWGGRASGRCIKPRGYLPRLRRWSGRSRVFLGRRLTFPVFAMYFLVSIGKPPKKEGVLAVLRPLLFFAPSALRRKRGTSFFSASLGKAFLPSSVQNFLQSNFIVLERYATEDGTRSAILWNPSIPSVSPSALRLVFFFLNPLYDAFKFSLFYCL